MNNPIGRVSDAHKVNLEYDSFEKRYNHQARLEKFDRFIDKKDRFIEFIGRRLRNVVNTIAVDSSPPTNNRNINHRAGISALALATILSGGGILISQIDFKEDKCVTVSTSDMGTSPGLAASEVSNLYADLPDSLIYDEALEDFMQNGETQVCGKYISRLPEQLQD